MYKQRSTSFVRVKIICVIQDTRSNIVLINYVTERQTRPTTREKHKTTFSNLYFNNQLWANTGSGRNT